MAPIPCLVFFPIFPLYLFSFFQILRNIEALHIPQQFSDFKQALLALRALDQLVSDPVLHPSYPTVISTWRKAWYTLFLARPTVTYPNKIHIVNCHLEVWYPLLWYLVTKHYHLSTKQYHCLWDQTLFKPLPKHYTDSFVTGVL